QRLRLEDPDCEVVLVHGRFRPGERRTLEGKIRENPERGGRIVVSTQVVEAGVDITSATLFTELCPWPSFVQRCGRCNRYGEVSDGADVFWVDLADELRGALLPYELEDLTRCRDRLIDLTQVGPTHLPAIDDPLPVSLVVRRRDLLELFDTDPDLSGFHVDVSPYIRDADETSLQVFWREIVSNDPNEPEPEATPDRDELCPTSLRGAREALKRRRGWTWDPLANAWSRLEPSELRPGIRVLLRSTDGGYDEVVGFDPRSKGTVSSLRPATPETPESLGSDRRGRRWVELSEHLRHVAEEVDSIAEALEVPDDDRHLLRVAAQWHDVGKAHELFQRGLLRTLAPSERETRNGNLWAKSAGKPSRSSSEPEDYWTSEDRKRRRYFRHELASMLSWLEQ
ncbi:MAG: hypothetical protein R3324_16750, partial [Halobacteriales archaeon]|nr:hypothetical protein [Halobacteriales archaeon]